MKFFWLFGFSQRHRSAEGPGGSHGAYAEALFAGWVPLLPDMRLCAGPALPPSDGTSDGSDFLARVYLHQHC